MSSTCFAKQVAKQENVIFLYVLQFMRGFRVHFLIQSSQLPTLILSSQDYYPHLKGAEQTGRD